MANPDTHPGTRRKMRGFTLIELMVVMTIMGILVSIALPQFRASILQAREAVLKEDLFRMRQAIDQYFADKGRYPATLEALVEDGYLRQLQADPNHARRGLGCRAGRGRERQHVFRAAGCLRRPERRRRQLVERDALQRMVKIRPVHVLSVALGALLVAFCAWRLYRVSAFVSGPRDAQSGELPPPVAAIGLGRLDDRRGSEGTGERSRRDVFEFGREPAQLAPAAAPVATPWPRRRRFRRNRRPCRCPRCKCGILAQFVSRRATGSRL